MTALSRQKARKSVLKDSVTIDDVAKLAGVSPKTVSRVVNGEAHVSPGTKDAVDRAVASLGYRPNLAARSLAAARSFLVGVISPYLESFYFRKLHSNTIRACKERGLHVIVELVDLETRDHLKHLESTLRQLRFEGVILTPPVCDRAGVLDLLDRLQIRYVRIAPSKEFGRSDCVCSDQAQGMKLLAEHFWALGHRRIASAVVYTRRRDPLREALIQLGANPAQIQSLALNWRERPITIGRQLAETILSQRHPPTAVFTFNDEVAAGLIGYAWEHGVRIPQDLSVAGYDDDEIAQAVWPLLTTVRQPLDRMAGAAVELLTEPALDGKVRRVVCPVELIVRSSTGARASHRNK